MENVLFTILHDKSRTVDAKRSVRKKISTLLRLAHEEISPEKRIDLHLNWFAVKKISVIQEIDTLLNTPTADFDRKFQNLFESKNHDGQFEIDKQIDALGEIIPASYEWYHQKIYVAEQSELKALKVSVRELHRKLFLLPDNKKTPYHRNKVIQDWQKETLRQINYDYEKHQGRVGLYDSALPTMRENVSNSKAYQDAEYAIQEHVYSEWQQITKEQLWIVDGNTCGDVLSSKRYCQNSTQRKELLLGASIAEELARNRTGDDFNRLDNIKTDTLKQARKNYQDRKDKMHEASLNAKEKHPHSKFKALTKFLIPQERDEETGLKVTSRERVRYVRQFESRESLNKDLENALAILRVDIHNAARTKNLKEMKESKEHPENKNEAVLDFQHAPVPSPVSVLKEDDALTATFDFAKEFFLFFDHKMMASRPFASMLLFSIPFMQVSGPILFSSGFLAKFWSLLLSTEAAAAKYTGLNEFLQFAVHQQLTAENIKQAIDLAREGAQWFTLATGTFEQAFLGLVVAKLTYNIGDLVINGTLGDKDSALISEFLTTLFPGVSGSLEGKTPLEQVNSVLGGIAKGTLSLGAAAFAVGGLEHYVPFIDAFLSKLAEVPWEAITQPHLDITALQTLGASKAAATIVFKIWGVVNQVQSGQLIDIDGHSVLSKESKSFEVLELFCKLTHRSKEAREELRNAMNPKALEVAREHFQELLSHNPSLLESFKNDNGKYDALDELGVELIVPKRRHKYVGGILKTIPALIKWGLGIPFLLLTVPTLLWSAASDKAPDTFLPKWLNPFYRYGLEGLHLWAKLGKAVWTAIKSVAHSFVAVTLRTPELAIAAIFFTPAILLTPFRPFGWLVGKVFGIDNPVTKAIRGIVKANAYCIGAYRDFRYSIKEGVGFILRKCRDFFVRKIEREMQVLPTEESVSAQPNRPREDLAPNQGNTSNINKQL